MFALIALAGAGSALADGGELLVGGSVVGEVWQDASVAAVYGPAGLGVAGVFSWRPHPIFSVDGGLSLVRMTGESEQALQLVPLTLGVAARIEREDMAMFVGAGPALVPFTDSGLSVITGTKPGLDVRAGVRLATDLVNPSLSSTSPVERVDAEIFLGRRQHFPGADAGLDLSAWRIGAGLVVRL